MATIFVFVLAIGFCLMMSSSSLSLPLAPKKTGNGSNRERESLAAGMKAGIEQFQFRSPTLDISCVRTIIRQLGYTPYNIVDVGGLIEFDVAGIASPVPYPLTAVVYPLNSNDLTGRYAREDGLKPFPTSMWMTCPVLHARISVLEDRGYITKLHSRLLAGEPDDPQRYANKMQEAHSRYAEFRWGMLSAEHKEYISSQGW